MAIANRYSVNFALISLLGPLTAIGLIIAAIATAFVTIDKLNTNPTVWVCLGVVCSLLGCFICFSYLTAKRLNPFEYDSDHLYFRKSILDGQYEPISYRALKEVLYSQNLIEQLAGTGTIVLSPRDKEHSPIRLKGVPDVKSTAGTLEKLRLAKQ